jgi:signal transduction histidine kinase
MRLRGALQVVCTTLLMWIFSASVASSATRRVVLLFDERPELPGLAQFDAEFVDKFASGSAEHVEVFREAMDLTRFSSDAHKVLLRDYLRKKYADKQINVTLAIRQPALDFLLDSVDPVFPGAAIVFLGVDSTYVEGRSLPRGVSGVLLTRKFAPTLELALRLHPMTENVVVVSGGAEIDTKLLEAAKKQFQPYDGRVSFRYLTALPMQELLKELSELPPTTIVLFTTFFRDGMGQAFVPHDVVGRVSKAASVPVYGFIDQYVGRGLVGGEVYSFAAHGAQAAMLALQVLGGNTSSGMVVTGRSMVLFDWRQLQRWKISESRLPPGSEILFREPTLWETYRWQLVTIAAVIQVQTALILWLLWERRRRRRLEVEGRQRIAELAHMNRQATAGHLSASIAHELNQPLGAILNNVETAKLMAASPSPNLEEIRTILDDIQRDDERASKVIKRLRRLLTRGAFDRQEVDLNSVVRDVVRIASAQAASHDVILGSNLVQQRLPVSGDMVQLQQVILNLIVNGIDAIAEMPNGVREIACRSWAADGHALIAIRDTGPGIPSDQLERLFEPFFTTKQDGMGMGLSIANTIIEAHGGKISAESRSSGAVFHVSLPLAKTHG